MQKAGTGMIEHELAKNWLPSRKQNLFTSVINELVRQHFWIATANGWPAGSDTVMQAMKSLKNDLYSMGNQQQQSAFPRLVVCLMTEGLDATEVMSALKELFPSTTNFQCATSCLGATSNAGFKSTPSEDGGPPKNLALWAIFDPLGAYATVGLVPNPDDAVCKVLGKLDDAYLQLRKQARIFLKTMDDTAEADKVVTKEPLADYLVIWLTSMVGLEEMLLAKIYHWSHLRFGRCVPVLGGTTADSTIGGKWFCFCKEVDGAETFYGGSGETGAVISMMAASVQTHTLFMHPFSPVRNVRAKVQACGSGPKNEGEHEGRVIHKVVDMNGKVHDAGTLYHEWCETHIQENLMPKPFEAPGPMAFNPDVLKASTLCPLGVHVADDGDDAFDYRTLHPSGIYFNDDDTGPEKGAYLKNFASVDNRVDDIVLLAAKRGDLLGRVTKLKEQLIGQLDRACTTGEQIGISPEKLHDRVAGAIMVYCAGCMMAVNSGADGRDQMRRLSVQLSKAYANRPFLASHPFGEQGFYTSKQKNGHANLMWSSLVFSRQPCFEIGAFTFTEALADVMASYEETHSSNDLLTGISDLITSCESVDWQQIAKLIDTNAMSPVFLQQLTLNATQPLRFAMRTAYMYYRLARNRPLKKILYTNEKQWYNVFCGQLVGCATMTQLAASNILTPDTLWSSISYGNLIDTKDVISVQLVQDVLQQIWAHGAPEKALKSLATGVSENAPFHEVPKFKFFANATVYSALIAFQFYLTVANNTNTWAWLMVCLVLFDNLLQSLCVPHTRYATMIDDVISLLCGIVILVKVSSGSSIPADLNCLMFLSHAVEVSEYVVVFDKFGPLMIVAQRLLQDMLRPLIVILVFFGATYLSMYALYSGTVMNFAGEAPAGPSGILTAVMWGTDILWSSQTQNTGNMFLSQLSGIDDAASLNIYHPIFMALCVFLGPILMFNMLIAMMASSYADVERKADLEWKTRRGIAVAGAVHLPPLPMLFSLPLNLVSLVKKISSLRLTRATPQDELFKRRSSSFRDEIIFHRAVDTAVTLVETWEQKQIIGALKQLVTTDQVERVRMQGETTLEKMHAMQQLIVATSAQLDVMAENMRELSQEQAYAI
eukprot:TRINITY_DN1094_c0_g1_i2.p1 TRINITY_DN1094_c0_g1~~TRINITY_DN1094_c0_g1_i2.p1  ORF type:complete len:1111 (+),score=185.26 TRINITY_DN1094_c0_g1_i2:57-3389(+)